METGRTAIPPGKRGGDKRTVDHARDRERPDVYSRPRLSVAGDPEACRRARPCTINSTCGVGTARPLIHHELDVKCREAIGRQASPTAAVIDSQSVKSAEKDAMGQAARQL